MVKQRWPPSKKPPQPYCAGPEPGRRSGLRLLPHLREQAPQAVILVLTGYASIATAVDAIKLGAAQYLAKPAGVDDILAAFEQREPNPAQHAPEHTMSVRRLTWGAHPAGAGRA